jgi:hypothetical protein
MIMSIPQLICCGIDMEREHLRDRAACKPRLHDHDRRRSRGMSLRTRTNVNALPLVKRNVGGRCYRADAPGNRAPGYSLGQREFLSYDRRVKITMSVTLAPELTEAERERLEAHRLAEEAWARQEAEGA